MWEKIGPVIFSFTSCHFSDRSMGFWRANKKAEISPLNDLTMMGLFGYPFTGMHDVLIAHSSACS